MSYNNNRLGMSRGRVIVVGQELPCCEPNGLASMSQPWPILLDQPSSQSNPVTWRFRSQVTLIVQDGVARALDTHNGRFHALDAVGTRMLLTTLQVGSGEMARALAHEYQIPEAQVRDDWVTLIEAFQQAGLTQTVRLTARERDTPGRLWIWVQLTLAWLSFWLLGWERTLRMWRHCVRRPVGRTPYDWRPFVTNVDGLVRRLASRHPLNPQCKERALVCWHLLRRMGLPARLLMGVMLYPFAAHAWTECHGRIVGDERGRCLQFMPVAVYE